MTITKNKAIEVWQSLKKEKPTTEEECKPYTISSKETAEESADEFLQIMPLLTTTEAGQQALQWYVPANNKAGMLLDPNGTPLDCAWFEYYLTEIAWTPSAGAHVVNQSCPVGEPGSSGFEYSEAWKHQIVPSSGPGNSPAVYWAGGNYCPAERQLRLCRRTDRHEHVFFAVNDSNYRDNAGGFKVTLVAWGW